MRSSKADETFRIQISLAVEREDEVKETTLPFSNTKQEGLKCRSTEGRLDDSFDKITMLYSLNNSEVK